MSSELRPTRGDLAAATATAAVVVLVLLVVTTVLVRGNDEVLRWYAVPTGLGAAGLLVWVIGSARAQSRARWSARADAVAERMAEVATWCGRLAEHMDSRSAGLSEATQIRLARVIAEGEGALSAWSDAPVRRRSAVRFERWAVRLLPEMAAADRRANHEQIIARRGT